MQSRGSLSARGGRSCVRESHASSAHVQVQRRQIHPPVVCHNWRAFGPTQEHSDGDADFYQTASRLTAQYPQWFPQQPQEEMPDVQEETQQQSGLLRERDALRPEFGLSTKQIQALGLGGMQSRLPDPVSERPCPSDGLVFSPHHH
jgi:hypothetical protein